jgi:hypothetical protein
LGGRAWAVWLGSGLGRSDLAVALGRSGLRRQLDRSFDGRKPQHARDAPTRATVRDFPALRIVDWPTTYDHVGVRGRARSAVLDGQTGRYASPEGSVGEEPMLACSSITLAPPRRRALAIHANGAGGSAWRLSRSCTRIDGSHCALHGRHLPHFARAGRVGADLVAGRTVAVAAAAV